MSNNPFEKANALGQKLFEIQNKAMTEFAKMQQDNMQKYMEASQAYASKLSEVRDPQTLMELQREMGETMWQNIQSGNENSGELMRSSWEEIGEAYRSAFTQESDS